MRPIAWLGKNGQIMKDSTRERVKLYRPGVVEDYPTPLNPAQPDAYYEGRLRVALAFIDRLLDPDDLGGGISGEVRGVAKQMKKGIQI